MWRSSWVECRSCTAEGPYGDDESEAIEKWNAAPRTICSVESSPQPSEIEESVIAQIRQRRDRGRQKYGTTMERTDLTTAQWLQHAQEEALDLAIYLERIKQELSKTST